MATRDRAPAGADPIDSTTEAASREEAAAGWRRDRDYGTRSDEEPLAETGDGPSHCWSVKRGKEMILLLAGGPDFTIVTSYYNSSLLSILLLPRSSTFLPLLPTTYHGSLAPAPDLPTFQTWPSPLYLLQAIGRPGLCVPLLSRRIHLLSFSAKAVLGRLHGVLRLFPLHFCHHSRALPWSFNYDQLTFRRTMLALNSGGNQMSTTNPSAAHTTPWMPQTQAYTT